MVVQTMKTRTPLLALAVLISGSLLAFVFAAQPVEAANKGDAMIAAGSPFPTFELTAHDESTVSSAGLAGSPYLVYFYPKADTPGCTREACELRDRWEDLEGIDLEVFGVSYDKPKKNAAFAAKYKLPFLLLSDQERSLSKAVGASSMLLPFPKRISYLVGSDGMVIKSYPKVVPAEHAGQVLEDFKALTE